MSNKILSIEDLSMCEIMPSKIDHIIHEPVRLGTLILLQFYLTMTFGEIQKSLDVTSGNLNSHLLKLSKFGLITITKKFVETKPRTFIEITEAGKQRLADYVQHFTLLLNIF